MKEERLKVTHFRTSYSSGVLVERNTFQLTCRQEENRVKQAMMTQSSVLLSVSPPSASGLISGGSSILVPQLRFGSQMMFSGLCWQLTCFTQPLPSWWPCGFTATPISSSRLPPFLGRQVCQTARRKIPSTKTNSPLILV